MRAKKATGALVVSLILLFVMIGVQVGTALTLGTQMWNIANPKTEAEEPVTAPDVDENTDWVGDIEIEAPLHDSEVLVSMELVYMDNECGAVITGILPDGGVWEYVTDNYEMTELEPITELHCFGDQYLFCAGGAVYALDVYTGKELWVNYDFGGYSPVFHCDGDDDWISSSRRAYDHPRFHWGQHCVLLHCLKHCVLHYLKH